MSSVSCRIMLGTLVIVLLCTLKVRTDEIPSWQSLKQLIHQKVEEIYGNYDGSDKYLKIESGKFFKYVIDDHSRMYEAYEEGTNTLPSWLSFSSKKNKLQGVPTDADVRNGIKIVFSKRNENAVNGLNEDKKIVQLDVLPNLQPFKCKQDSTTVVSLIFHSDIKNYDGASRVKFLRAFVSRLECSRVTSKNSYYCGIKDLHLEGGNRMDSESVLTADVRMAGPGDQVRGEQPGFTVSWKLKCGYELAGDKTVAFLRELSQKEDFSSIFNEKVLGWFITSTNQRSRRAIGLSGTPGTTPTLLIPAGTPTLGPSASVVVKTTTIVRPTPTKSVEMKMTSMPPVITTTASPMKPVTKSTTQSTKTTTTKEPIVSTKHPTLTPGNTGPEVVNPIQEIHVFEHQAVQYEVPSNVFNDDNNDPLIILLKYYPGGSAYPQPLPPGYWIAYSKSDKMLYLLPEKRDIGTQRFVLIATDKSGESANDLFDVTVKQDTTFYNNIFNLTLDLDFESFNNSVEDKVKLAHHIAKATNTEKEKFRALKLSRGSVVIQWGIEDSNYDNCNNPTVQAYKALLDTAEFRDTMAPDYDVLKSGLMVKKDCPDNIPAEPVTSDESLWTRILIPVIVIVIILFIVAFILCCVYRRKRKYEPQTDQDDNYLNHKKPVIFLEEYDEKPDFVSLQPLILPNEKPPVQQAYEPRAGTPDGPESSTTVSTESDERAPLAPLSPKESPRKAYNAPPPYSAHS